MGFPHSFLSALCRCQQLLSDPLRRRQPRCLNRRINRVELSLRDTRRRDEHVTTVGLVQLGPSPFGFRCHLGFLVLSNARKASSNLTPLRFGMIASRFGLDFFFRTVSLSAPAFTPGIGFYQSVIVSPSTIQSDALTIGQALAHGIANSQLHPLTIGQAPAIPAEVKFRQIAGKVLF